ncbi:MAG: polysaccharide biosynthesis/export family protein [bacterium]
MALGRLARSAWGVALVASLVLGSVASRALAQAPAPAVPPTAEYTVGIGDKLEINVWQRPDLGATVIVDSQGDVTLPLIGAIRAAGSTPGKFGEELTRRLSFVDRDVSLVTVSVLEYNSRRVFVMGEVTKPGAYSFPTMPGVWEAIREAGGPTADAALTRVKVVPPASSGPPSVIDLDHAIATGDFSSLPALSPGTTILVPRAEAAGSEGDVVYVYGRVKTPGAFSIDNARSALHAVLAAGGPLDDANMSSVKVVRPGPVQARVFEVNLNDYTSRGKLFPNVPLLPGDCVTVPQSRGFFLWTALVEVGRSASNVLGTIFFFTNSNKNNTNQGTTVIVQPQQGQQTSP